tara:strand:+ start:329 stop:805 length:477 start_codon:yes stop_codon:yes gene_type:complete
MCKDCEQNPNDTFPFEKPQLFDYKEGRKQFSKELSKQDLDMLLEMCWIQTKLINEQLHHTELLETLAKTTSKQLMMTNYVVQAMVIALEKIDMPASDLFMEELTNQILADPMLAEDSAEVLQMMKDKDLGVKSNLHIDEMQWKNLVTRMQNAKSMEEE